MTRSVRQINVTSGSGDEHTPRLFSEFCDGANIVLLGDPGAGKTHLFRETALAAGALYIEARAFLNRPAAQLSGRDLFIDALDEKRAGRGDRDTVDAIVAKLFEINPPRVRISCRVLDWLGESDLAALAPFFAERGETCVLHLQRLSRPEQQAVLANKDLGEGGADVFLDEAERRGLIAFVENPQNLLMLWEVVKAGSWPESLCELFERSTALLLEEANQEHARSGAGVYTAGELRSAAGAIFAARLISDVDAISLTTQGAGPNIPAYRSLSFMPPEQALAALSRRVFQAASAPETVDYAHRTTAEYLAAAFLAARVRVGLPLGRVRALIGVDGHPASELRGLHAWLAVHLPEQAEALIEADPYGVLTYGDAASLSSSLCACLLRALARLSQANPWFRRGAPEAASVGALARADMLDAFRTILGDEHAGSGARITVLDALVAGKPIAALLPDLAAILGQPSRPFNERWSALEALLRYGEPGKAALQDASATRLGDSADDLRLRDAILRALYGEPYGASDVIALVHDASRSIDRAGSGLLWMLVDRIPSVDLPVLLDGIEPPTPSPAYDARRSWDAGTFYSRILVRVWREPGTLDPASLLAWFAKRRAFGRILGEGRPGDLKEAMEARPDRLRDVAVHFFASVAVDDGRWLAFHRFREVTLFALTADELLDIVVGRLDSSGVDEGRRIFHYEVALRLLYEATPQRCVAKFEALYARANRDPLFLPSRTAALVAHLPEGFFAGRSAREPPCEESRDRLRDDFDREIADIRSGRHRGWLGHLARIYFAVYSDVDRAQPPRERLAAWLGETRVDAVIDSFRSSLRQADLPALADVLALTAEHKHFEWWYALIAGLSERFADEGLTGLSDDFLQAMLVYDLTNPVWAPEDGAEHRVEHPWRAALMAQRPDIVRDAYLAVVRLRLSRNEQYVEGLTEVLKDPAFEAFRGEIALDLLDAFPNADPFRLGDMIDAIAGRHETHARFFQRAEAVRSGTVPVGERQSDLWLAAAFAMAPASIEAMVQSRAEAKPDFVFDLRERTGFDRQEPAAAHPPLPVLAFLARLTGRLFENTSHPSGVYGGDRNAWDASDFFRSLVNAIAAMPSAAATDALVSLESDPQLASYRNNIRYVLAEQRQRRRDAEYDRPTWDETVAALNGQAPATVADLHALAVAQLAAIAQRIARENTDLFKQFWNVDSNARPTEPRPEETCRDVLITQLRPLLLPLGVTVEPEAHMAADRRADISIAMPGRKILVELKRDYHAEVWTAAAGQLERLYAHDPEARGFGIYGVFWFGARRTRAIPGAPDGIEQPTAAAEMETRLRSLLPPGSSERLAVMVLDVSGDG